MTKTQLVEFKNNSNDIVRGICAFGKSSSINAVLMCGGFERTASTEKKFKVMADELFEKNIASLRFDYSGMGLSDGAYSKTTVQKMVVDFKNAYKILQAETDCQNISVVAHSLSACVVARAALELVFDKMVLIAPALNQKDLMRYWFTLSVMKKQNFDLKVDWHNFKDYLDENQFQADCQRMDKMTKENYILADYFLENKELDYADLMKSHQNILHIHGDKDDKVPFDSVNIQTKNQIMVKGGDHDVERPDMRKQWVQQTIDFIIKN